MIDFTEIPEDGEIWELFARDFLSETGFYIESVPDRGPDGGKDIIVTELLEGHLGTYRFRWLVSCKHYAKSRSSVNETRSEPNILERVTSFSCDGFIGFYSTIPSSGLTQRLEALKREEKIKDFRFFDSRLIENYLLRIGYSALLMRYFPASYQKIRPLHCLLNKYIPLQCDHCGKDLLEALYREDYQGLVAYVTCQGNKVTHVKDLYLACKGDCDRRMEGRLREPGCITSWKDLSELVMPLEFLRWLMATMNKMRSQDFVYSDKAFDKEKTLILALAQKVFREGTEREQERVAELMSMPF